MNEAYEKGRKAAEFSRDCWERAASDGILRGRDAKRFTDAVNNPKPISEKERKRIMENYEAMVKIIAKKQP